MFKLITLILLMTPTLYAKSTYTTKTMDSILESVQVEELTYIGRKLLSGYYSIESCIHTGDNVIVIKNYCYPKKKYPARSLTLISHQFGIVELYEEVNGYDIRRITQISFPEHIKQALPKNLRSMSMDEIDFFLSENEKKYNPACWSFQRTNPDPLEQNSCYKADPSEYHDWLMDTFDYVKDKQAWDTLYDKLL